jgi:hypothetical protein
MVYPGPPAPTQFSHISEISQVLTWLKIALKQVAHMAQDRSEEDEEQVELNTANARGSHTQALTTLKI